uniref:Uncharacterized protein n=1 Tax=Philodina roseola TaxID=96448 RepID=B6S361_PHIRO|nr:unknown [Philodina roseola]
MPGRNRTAKTTEKQIESRQLSPEIPTPVKTIADPVHMDDQPFQVLSQSDQNQVKPMDILLANGQPLLTNFEEKYLIDFVSKSSTDDIERLIQEKISSILQMNYGSSSSLYRFNAVWLFDFCLKHFQTLINHHNAAILFENLLKKTFDKNNATLAFKYWQLETLVNEHMKKNPHPMPQKRRMTVRQCFLVYMHVAKYSRCNVVDTFVLQVLPLSYTYTLTHMSNVDVTGDKKTSLVDSLDHSQIIVRFSIISAIVRSYFELDLISTMIYTNTLINVYVDMTIFVSDHHFENEQKKAHILRLRYANILFVRDINSFPFHLDNDECQRLIRDFRRSNHTNDYTGELFAFHTNIDDLS